jgi:hypothetical protein
MITLPRLRKRNLSNGLVPVLDWAAIFNYYAGTWVDLDDRKRPKKIPALPEWATPEGWRQGLRPQQRGDSPNSDPLANAKPGTGHGSVAPSSLILQIEALAEPLGKRMYRGLLKRIAKVWNPREIQDAGLQRQVLAHMQAAEPGFPPTGCGAR